MEDTLEKVNYDQREIELLTLDVCQAIDDDDWRPDLIAGIGRGGLTPGVMISHYFDIPFYALNWSTRDHENRVSEAALAEDVSNGKRVLIIDDICDTGETFRSLVEDWESSVFKELDLGGDLRMAALHYRKSCEYEVDYIGEFINDEWIVYPWENWWG